MRKGWLYRLFLWWERRFPDEGHLRRMALLRQARFQILTNARGMGILGLSGGPAFATEQGLRGWNYLEPMFGVRYAPGRVLYAIFGTNVTFCRWLVPLPPGEWPE